MKKLLFRFFVISAAVFFSGCSSTPKRPMVVTEKSDNAGAMYEAGNKELVSGELRAAGWHLQEAYKIALSVDDADLLCRVSLSAIIFKLSYSPALYVTQNPETGEIITETIPFSGLSARDLLSQAEVFASRAKKKELLSALCKIYRVKIEISEKNVDVNQAVAVLNDSLKKLEKEPYYQGFYYRTKGDVYAFDKNYGEARKAYLEAAQIHTKNRYLSEIGLDYYNAARMSSLAGNKNDALNEISAALKYDKDAENSAVIAADYYAYGLILLKNGCSEEEKERAKSSILWAGAVYDAAGFYTQAKECRDKASTL